MHYYKTNVSTSYCSHLIWYIFPKKVYIYIFYFNATSRDQQNDSGGIQNSFRKFQEEIFRRKFTKEVLVHLFDPTSQIVNS